MAFSTAPTLCEVTYDISDEEKRYTPFRYQCRSAPARQNVTSPTGNSEVTNYSLPSGLTVTYYEYLRSLYDSRIQSAHVNHKASIETQISRNSCISYTTILDLHVYYISIAKFRGFLVYCKSNFF